MSADGAAEAEAAAFVARLQRDVNTLSDADKHKRRRALDTVARELAALPSAQLRCRLVLRAELARPLAVLLADPVEMNREAAIQLVRATADALADAAPAPAPAPSQPPASAPSAEGALVAFLMPVLLVRVARTPFPEDSEELRLQLVQLLNRLLALPACARAVGALFADLAEVVRCLSGDAFHSVKCEASASVQLLCAAAPTKARLALGALAAASVANFGHQRHPVRLGALLALHRLLPLGAEGLQAAVSSGASAALPALRALRFDRTPTVRRQLAATAAHLLVSLPGDVLAAAGCEAQLVALSLALMADDTAEVREAALACFEAAAATRRAQLEGRLPPHLRGGVGAGVGAGAGAGTGDGDDAMGASEPADLAVAAAAAAPDDSVQGYAAAADSAQAMSVALGYAPRVAVTATPSVSSASASSASSFASSASSAHHLPPPFAGRPNVDAIWVVQRSLPQLVPLLVGELRDWTLRVRLSAAGALRSLLVLAEDAATTRLDELVSALCGGSRDEDAEVRRTLSEVGRLLGAFVAVPAQLAVLLPQLRGEAAGLNNAQHYAAALSVLAACLSSASRRQLRPLLPPLAAALALPALAEEEPRDLRRHLAAALAFAVRVGVAGERFPGVGAGGGGGGADGSSAGGGGGAAQLAVVPAGAEGAGDDDDDDDDDNVDEGGGSGGDAGTVDARFPALRSSALWSGEGALPPLTASRAHLVPDAALDALLRCALHLSDGRAGSASDVAASARDSLCVLARALRFAAPDALFAARMHSLLPPLQQQARGWARASHGRAVFDSLVRCARGGLVGRDAAEARRLVDAAVDVFVATLGVSKDAELRVVQLALLDAFICDSSGGGGNGLGLAVSAAAGAATAAVASPSAAPAPAAPPAGAGALPGATESAVLAARAALALSRATAATATATSFAAAALPASAAEGGGGGSGDCDCDIAMPQPNLLPPSGAAPYPSPLFSRAAAATVDALLADSAGELLQQALLPNAVWRVGLVASTIRKVSCACMLSLGQRGLLPLHALQPVFAELLPVMRSCLGDDDATTRHVSCLALAAMLAVLRRAVGHEDVRLLYPELLKRLDDSNDAVRASGCRAVAALAACARPEDLAGQPCEYTIDTLLVHLDDADGAIQAAVFGALVPYCRLAPTHARKAVAAARDAHRHPGHCNRLLEIIAGSAAK